jgi:hypothetical protein
MHLVGYLYEDYHDARSLEHKVPTRSLSVNCPMFVQFGIRDLNVMLLAFPRILRQSAMRRSTFLTNANKITQNAHTVKPSYMQTVKSTSVNVTEHTIKMLLNVATRGANIISSTSNGQWAGCVHSRSLIFVGGSSVQRTLDTFLDQVGLDCWIYCSVYLNWFWYVYFYLSAQWQMQVLLSYHSLMRNFEGGLSLFAEVNEALQYLKNEIAKRAERCYIHLLFSELTKKRPNSKFNQIIQIF